VSDPKGLFSNPDISPDLSLQVILDSNPTYKVIPNNHVTQTALFSLHQFQIHIHLCQFLQKATCWYGWLII